MGSTPCFSIIFVLLALEKNVKHRYYTLKCLSIGTPKTINFPFVPNGKLMVLGFSIFEHIIIAVICPNFGTPKNNQF